MENKYFIYARKSSEQEDKQVLSIESQLSELAKIVDKLGLELTDTIPESRSAKYTGRLEFNLMLERIIGGEANSILVWHPDRISRNPEDSARIISLLDSGQLLQVLTPTQKFTNNPMDKFMLGFFMMQAKFENDSKGENVKRGLRTKAEMGWYSGVAKFGYLNNKYKEKGEKDIYSDPDRFKIARRMWDLMLTGLYSPPQILKIANEDWGVKTVKRKRSGGNPLSRSFIYNFFTDPFYYGEYEWLDTNRVKVWHKGKHEPMITKEEYDRVQILLGKKGRPRPQIYTFAYTGLMRCGGCGASVTADEKWQMICSNCKFKFSSNNKANCPDCNLKIEEMKNPKILHYIYYKCTKRKDPNCTERSVEVGGLEEQITKYLLEIGIPETFRKWALEHLNKENDQEIDDRTTVYKSLQTAYNEAQKGSDELTKMRYKQLIDDEEFQRQQAKLKGELKGLKDKLEDTEHRAKRWEETTEETFNFARRARYWLEHGSVEDKRIILDGLGSNIILQGKKVQIELEKPLLKIEEGLARMKEKSLFEPGKEIDLSSNKRLLQAQKAEWLPG